VIFYDGRCGLCHSTVRFAIRHDPEGHRFLFAPLQGETCRLERPSEASKTLAHSVVVIRADGATLERSDAALFLLEEIGGSWRWLGRALALIPRSLRNLVYRGVVKTRRLLFRTPKELCPVVPPSIRSRFLP